jgi:hypothetical protein
MSTGKEGHEITVEQAREQVRRWQDGKTARAGDPVCELFSRNVLDKILAQPGCAGLRIYHGRNDKGQHTVVLVGAAADGSNLTDVIAEQGVPCPPVCPVAGHLA